MSFIKAKKNKQAKCMPLYMGYCIPLVALCYGFSPLIQFYSTDSSVFYCVGKAMTNGLVPYKDIFDHKGLWTYLFNYFGASLDSVLNGWGMCLIEALVYLIIIVAADRIFSLFIRNERLVILCACLFLAWSINYFTYQAGNYTESYALAFQMISCALMVKYWVKDKTSKKHPPVYMLVHGICSGICFFLRMNLVGIWIPFGMAIVYELLKAKEYKNLLLNISALLCGVALATTPVVVYGIYNDCIKDMFFCMFTYNLSYVGDGTSAAEFLKDLFFSGASAVLVVSIICSIAVMLSKKIPMTFRLMFSVGFLFVVYITFMGMRTYGHYYQVLIPYTIPAFLFLGREFEKSHFSIKKNITFGILLLACFTIAIIGNMRAIIKFGSWDNEYRYLYDTVQKANECISSDEENSLLSTGNLMQAYVITNTIPTMKYPYIPGAELTEASESMYDNILSGNYKYIFGTGYENGFWSICSGEKQDRINEFISENYVPISVSNKYSYVMFMRNDGEVGENE